MSPTKGSISQVLIKGDMMLTFLRKKKIAKKVLWFLAIIIIPAFVLWGAGSLSKRKLPFKYIGTIEGKKVPVDEFVDARRDVRIGLFLNYFNQPQALDKLQKDRALLNRLAWENLIMYKSAKKDRITVSDKEVIGYITHHPLFAKGGVFDDKLYKYILKNSLGITPRTFEESVRIFLVNAKYKDNIIKSVTVSDEEARQFYKNEFEKAKVSYVLIDQRDFKESVQASETEIASFYEKNKEHFKEREKVVLQYIAFPHKEEGEKEKALADLKRAYEKLRSRPRDMEKLAGRLNLAVRETPAFSVNEPVPGIKDIRDINIVSFSLQPLADILPVVNENELGTSYIIRVKEKIPPRIKREAEVSGYIEDIIKNEKAFELARERARHMHEEATADNMPLKKMAKIYDLELGQTDLISRFDYIEGVGESYGIVENAFGLAPGEISKPIEVRSGLVIIEPVKLLPVDEEKFEKEKEDYKNRVLTIKKMKAMENWFRKTKLDTALKVDLNRL